MFDLSWNEGQVLEDYRADKHAWTSISHDTIYSLLEIREIVAQLILGNMQVTASIR